MQKSATPIHELNAIQTIARLKSFVDDIDADTVAYSAARELRLAVPVFLPPRPISGGKPRVAPRRGEVAGVLARPTRHDQVRNGLANAVLSAYHCLLEDIVCLLVCSDSCGCATSSH